jgi:hypothetical protein
MAQIFVISALLILERGLIQGRGGLSDPTSPWITIRDLTYSSQGSEKSLYIINFGISGIGSCL